jgi:ATP-binding cassette subfamily B (MDR/TAP) protein 6
VYLALRPISGLPLSKAAIHRSMYFHYNLLPQLTIPQLIYFLILVLGCVVNAFLPLILGALITTFDTPGVAPFPPFGSSPWSYLITHVLLRCLASSSGLAAIRDALWIPLMQYSDRSM